MGIYIGRGKSPRRRQSWIFARGGGVGGVIHAPEIYVSCLVSHPNFLPLLNQSIDLRVRLSVMIFSPLHEAKLCMLIILRPFQCWGLKILRLESGD